MDEILSKPADPKSPIKDQQYFDLSLRAFDGDSGRCYCAYESYAPG